MRFLLAATFLVGCASRPIVIGSDDGTTTTTGGAPGTAASFPSFSSDLYATGNNSWYLASSDFDGNGSPDLVVANDSDKSLTTLLNDGKGHFQTTTQLQPEGVLFAGNLFDATQKGGVALISDAVDSGAQLFSLESSGDGTFHQVATYPYPAQHFGQNIEARDLDADGHLDLIYTRWMVGVSPTANADHTLVIRRGNGDGTFDDERTFDAGLVPRHVVVDDFDGDGLLDVIVSGGYGNQPPYPTSIALLRGKGDGTFSSPEVVAATGEVPWLCAGDLNGDGKPDLVAVEDQSNPFLAVRVYLAKGNGRFGEAVTSDFQISYRTVAMVALADFNGDGKPDLVAPSHGGESVISMALGVGDGTFDALHTIDVGGWASWTQPTDLNGDGLADLAVLEGTNELRIMLNTSKPPIR